LEQLLKLGAVDDGVGLILSAGGIPDIAGIDRLRHSASMEPMKRAYPNDHAFHALAHPLHLFCRRAFLPNGVWFAGCACRI
jgi:hypothetical protein